MHYLSTRDHTLRYTAAEAIKQGLSRDGGLFLPEEIPALRAGQLEKMASMSYQERAVEIMSLYLEDFSREELAAMIHDYFGIDIPAASLRWEDV